MTEFSYKPALLAGRKTYRLDADDLIRLDGDGNEDWRLPWGDIIAAAYVETLVKRNNLRRLDLAYGTGRKRRAIGYNGPEALSTSDPDSIAHLNLCAAILERLAQRDPAFQVSVGEYGGGRIALFGIGALSLVFAVAIGIGAALGGVSGGKLAEAAVPMVFMAIIGVALCKTYAPWRPRDRLAAPTVALALTRMATPEADIPDS